jgi:hypothetical protein
MRSGKAFEYRCLIQPTAGRVSTGDTAPQGVFLETRR